jgi:tetratricopeptide (TPR) repeat protein
LSHRGVALKSRLLGVALLLTPLVARAEDAPKPYAECDHAPTEGDVAGAKGAFQAGQASFDEGDYNRAISYWEDAYRRDCTAHALLLNLARAYELNNQKRHAVHALETFVARKPDAGQRDQIARRIEGLNEKIAQEKGQPEGTTPPPAGNGETPKPGGPVGTPQPDKGTGGGSRPITPLIVAGAGGVLTIVGGLFYLKAAGDVKDIDNQCPDRNKCSAEQADKGNAARRRQNVWGAVTIVGIAAAVGGTIWYFLTPANGAHTATAPQKRKALPRVDPVVSSGFAGLSVSGAF